MIRRAFLGGIAMTLCSLSVPLSAQPSESEPTGTEAARALFDEGLELADDGEWERAVHRFRAALEQRESAAVRYNLAISLARMGRLVEALEEIARVTEDPAADEEIHAEARLLQTEITPRLGRLRVEVQGGAQGANVTVDGRPWVRLGLFSPADPGVRVVRLIEGDEELDVEEAEVPEGADAEVILEHPRAEPNDDDEGSDDSWIWGTVIGVVIVAVGAAVVTGIVLADL